MFFVDPSPTAFATRKLEVTLLAYAVIMFGLPGMKEFEAH